MANVFQRQTSPAILLHKRREHIEQQIREHVDQSFTLGTAFAGVLTKLEADSAALSRDEQAQIHRALALTEQRGTTQTQAESADLDLAAQVAALPS